MFDIGALELLLIVVVAILVIGPKDMPAAMRVAGRWIGKMRKLSGQFRSGIDAMVRESELEEMEKKWKAQNEKVMRDYPNGSPEEMEPSGAYPPKAELEASAEARLEGDAGGSAPEASTAKPDPALPEGKEPSPAPSASSDPASSDPASSGARG